MPGALVASLLLVVRPGALSSVLVITRNAADKQDGMHGLAGLQGHWTLVGTGCGYYWLRLEEPLAAFLTDVRKSTFPRPFGPLGRASLEAAPSQAMQQAAISHAKVYIAFFL